jgi:hypothetical protein
MPRELMYTLTYLVSLAVHFDGHGKSSAFLLRGDFLFFFSGYLIRSFFFLLLYLGQTQIIDICPGRIETS